MEYLHFKQTCSMSKYLRVIYLPLEIARKGEKSNFERCTNTESWESFLSFHPKTCVHVQFCDIFCNIKSFPRQICNEIVWSTSLKRNMRIQQQVNRTFFIRTTKISTLNNVSGMNGSSKKVLIKSGRFNFLWAMKRNGIYLFP